jgi:NADH dehydrogenase
MEWITGDVLEPAGWRAHLRGCGAVIHCVGIIREDARRGATFERINGDSAITAAEEADGAGVGTFVFVSASAKPPLVGEGYIRGKRRAEARIQALRPRPVILRPGFVYGAARLPSLPAAALLSLAGLLPIVGAAARHSRPVAAETLARAALRAAADESVRGILDADTIERLGKEAGN